MVYKVLSDRILNHLSRNTEIDMEYREIYAYAIEKYFSGIVNAILFSFIAIVCRIPREAITFFIFYAPLRRYAGGRHAKTRTICFLLSAITMVTVIKSATYLSGFELWRGISIAGMVASALLVFLFAPVDCENKRFSEKVRIQNRRKSRGIVIIELLIIIAAILYLPLLKAYIMIAVMALLLEGIILVPNIKRRLSNDERKKEK